jgi:hypothetical protein
MISASRIPISFSQIQLHEIRISTARICDREFMNLKKSKVGNVKVKQSIYEVLIAKT